MRQVKMFVASVNKDLEIEINRFLEVCEKQDYLVLDILYSTCAVDNYMEHSVMVCYRI